jgi:Glycerophosphoryl diester phosphodiesterase family
VFLAIAHRGDPSAYRENTMPSFRSAVAKGANTLEFDLRLTSDVEDFTRESPQPPSGTGTPCVRRRMRGGAWSRRPAGARR